MDGNTTCNLVDIQLIVVLKLEPKLKKMYFCTINKIAVHNLETD